MLTILLALQLATAQPEPIKFDWKPTAWLTAGVIADLASTKLAVDHNPLCAEGNARYTRSPFAGRQPNYKLMLADKALFVGSFVLAELIQKWASNHKSMQTEERRQLADGSRQLTHLHGYALGTYFGYMGARNLARCY